MTSYNQVIETLRKELLEMRDDFHNLSTENERLWKKLEDIKTILHTETDWVMVITKIGHVLESEVTDESK